MDSYNVSYEYVNPGPAGPTKGKMVFRGDHPAKGDVIYAVFGRAVVKSVRKIKGVS